MNVAETNAQILKILSDLKNCQENLLNDMLIISEKPRILDERVQRERETAMIHNLFFFRKNP